MKVALLSLAVVASTISANGYEPESRGYGRPSKDYGEDQGYRSDYSTPGYENPSGYGKVPPTGYGKVPPSGYGKAPPTGYGKDGYGKPPAPVVDRSKNHFDQFYDNLKFCAAETTLAQCIISSQSRQECGSPNRINTCTTQFINNLCTNIASTTTGTYNNGYFKATSNTCVDAALADSLLVYNKLIKEADSALVETPQIDSWAFAGIKLALSTTRTHADCVIKGFFNYLNGCARSRVLRPKDTECLQKVLNNEKGTCDWAYDDGDGWSLSSVLKMLKDRPELAKEYNIPTATGGDNLGLIQTLINGIDKTELNVVALNPEYNFKLRQISVTVKTETDQKSRLHPKLGTDVNDIVFHLPFIAPKAAMDGEIPPNEEVTKWDGSIQNICKEFYQASEKTFTGLTKTFTVSEEINGKIYAYRLNDANDIECAAKPAEKKCSEIGTNDVANINSDPRYTALNLKDVEEKDTFIPQLLSKLELTDKCYSYNGYSITYLETGETKALSFPDIVASSNVAGDSPKKVFLGATEPPKDIAIHKVTWSEPHSCNSHLTQWKQSISCCKNYYTVLREQQATWDKQNKNKGYKKIVESTRPKAVTSYDASKQSAYKKTLTSKKSSGAIVNKGPLGPEDFTNVEEIKKFIEKKLKKAAAIKAKHDIKNGVSAESPSVEKSVFGSDLEGFAQLCDSFKRGWDIDTVIPIVSTRCFPQSCVLSQLTKCIEIPEKKSGYDYVAQPLPGYNGYPPSSFTRYTLALESVHTSALAVFGFAAGAAVVVVAQALIKVRTSAATASPNNYLLV